MSAPVKIPDGSTFKGQVPVEDIAVSEEAALVLVASIREWYQSNKIVSPLQ